jgi:hypothetical protein
MQQGQSLQRAGAESLLGWRHVGRGDLGQFG